MLEALTDHFEAIAERDIDRFAATLAADDIRFIGGDGSVIEGRDNVIAAHRDWFAGEGWTFEPEIVATREENALGWVLTRVRYADRGEEKYFWLSFVLVSENGDWKVFGDQNTALPTPDRS